MNTSDMATCGTYRGKDIPRYVDSPERGGRFQFDRIAYNDPDGSTPLSQLRSDEFVVYPGLIYRGPV